MPNSKDPYQMSILELNEIKKFVRKGCKFFVVHVMNDELMNKVDKFKI